MENTQTRKYNWLSIVVGIISIILGFWCIFTPINTLAALTLLFIIGFFVAGIFDLFLALGNTGSQGWGWRLATGIIDILLGIWLCAMPGAEAATVLIYVVGFYICFYSAMGIGEACHLRSLGVKSWGWMLFFNIVGILTSFIFLLSPLFGVVFISWLVGLAFLSYGFYRCMYPTL